MHLDDTIAAIASAPGGALRGIVRVSGPQCVACVEQVFVPAAGQTVRRTRVPSCLSGELLLPRDVGRVPAVLYVWPTERSYTRQPSAELHLVGSLPLVEAALEAICKAGARLARPGEFTLRAFLAGRLDLTQAEAVLGVIDARGQAELNVALAQLAGGLARPLHSLREELLDLLAHLEAGLDFVEEDIEFIGHAEMEAQLAAAAEQVARIAERMQARGQSGQLPRVVLLGEPNAGKSSLFNALAGHSAAIVSDIAGTTRDYVARRVVFSECHLPSRTSTREAAQTPESKPSLPAEATEGIECLLIDTAGLHQDAGADAIAAAAKDATQQQAQQADLVLLCLDAAAVASTCPNTLAGEMAAHNQPPRLVVWTKCDLPPAAPADEQPAFGVKTSSVTGEGIDALRRAIAAALESRLVEPVLAGTADRCRESLRLAASALERAQQAARAKLGEELVAAEVRLALEELGQVAGAIYTDDVLDRVFSRFCIGK
jgi:tRNA modification GTPase